MPNILLVTGTDTGVGKTFISSRLIRELNLSGLDTVGIKPIETGCNDQSQLVEDGTALWEASGRRGHMGAWIRLSAPLAPAAAADLQGIRLDYQQIVEFILEQQKRSKLLVVEGAGGLLVPITWQMSFLDLAQSLDASVLIVARAGLGTINHTLLTYRELRRLGIPVTGIILNQSSLSDDISIRSNRSSIDRLLNYDRISLVPYLKDGMGAIDQFNEIVDWVKKDLWT
jgi:dethiobiotin synthetase